MGDSARGPAPPASSPASTPKARVHGADVIIVGAGLMGRWHCYTARRLGARVVGVVDRDLDAARALGRRAGGATSADRVTKLLDRPPFAAHVCTPTGAHYQAARELIEAGVHVLIEKPLCQTAKESEELTKAAALSSVLVCPVHQYAFQRGVDQAETWLRGLGAARRISFDIRSAGAEALPDGRQSEVIHDILPHPISILQRLFPGMPITDLDWSVTAPSQGEYVAHAVSGTSVVTLSISLNARPTCFHTRVLTDGGEIDIDGFHGFATLTRGSATRGGKIAAPFDRSVRTIAAATTNLARRAIEREPAYTGLAALVRAFYQAAQSHGARAAPISIQDIVTGMQAWERLRSVPADSSRLSRGAVP